MLDPTDFTSADALLALEKRAAESITSGLRQTLAVITRTLLRLWPGDDAPLGERLAVLQAVPLERLLDASKSLDTRIREFEEEASSHGIETALAQVALAGVNIERPKDLVLPEVEDTAQQALTEQVRKARVVLATARTLQQAQVGMGVAQYGITRVESIARAQVNSAANSGSDRVANSESGLVSIWRAERNACVHCLAYSGKVDTGKGYASATYGKKPLQSGRIKRPPLHPNCRCDQIVTTQENQNALSTAMRREADRSILRGFSLESESNSVRIDAAKRLLNRGVKAPQSVKTYAERAIRKGEFGRGRSLPPL